MDGFFEKEMICEECSIKCKTCVDYEDYCPVCKDCRVNHDYSCACADGMYDPIDSVDECCS